MGNKGTRFRCYAIVLSYSFLSSFRMGKFSPAMYWYIRQKNFFFIFFFYSLKVSAFCNFLIRKIFIFCHPFHLWKRSKIWVLFWIMHQTRQLGALSKRDTDTMAVYHFGLYNIFHSNKAPTIKPKASQAIALKVEAINDFLSF